MRLIGIMAATAVIAVAIAASAVAMNGSETNAAAPSQNRAGLADGKRASDLRVKLGSLLGEHAQLAINATRKGYNGDKDFAASAAALDQNAVELASVIGSVYGPKARAEFLNGAFKWRSHIKSFVRYTVALKGKDKGGQTQAVNDLKGYIGSFSGFLAAATKLPPAAVRARINMHVMLLKGQIDAYSRGQYAKAYRLERTAYKHMFMTGDVLAAAIAKQKNL